MKRDAAKGDAVRSAGGPDSGKDAAEAEPGNETVEHTARRIAQRGRDELVARLRPAFEQAAAAHGDLLELGPEQLESMVQEAADRADGLQWRRALAAVASRELEIGLGEALSHPAVVRAQAIVGAPSYEESLAQLMAPRGTDPSRAPQAEGKAPEQRVGDMSPEPTAEEAPAPTAEEAPDQRTADEAPDQPAANATGGEADAPAGGPQATGRDEDAQEAGRSEARDRKAQRQNQAVERRARIAERQQRIAAGRQQPGEEVVREGDPPPSTLFPRLRLPAIHLGGIAKLAPGEADIVLRFSEEGLDIVRRSSAAALGRLGWTDISELEIPAARGLRRRRRRQGAELVIRAGQGDANFEIPNLTSDQLRSRLAPALARLQRQREDRRG